MVEPLQIQLPDGSTAVVTPRLGLQILLKTILTNVPLVEGPRNEMIAVARVVEAALPPEGNRRSRRRADAAKKAADKKAALKATAAKKAVAKKAPARKAAAKKAPAKKAPAKKA